MRKLILLFCLSWGAISACSSSQNVMVKVEPLTEAKRAPTVEVEIIQNIEDIDREYTEIARLHATEFSSEDVEDQILEAMVEEAKDLGADAVVVKESTLQVVAKRDMQRGGISTGVERTVEASAVIFN